MACGCTGGMMLVRGVPTCTTCHAPVVLPAASGPYSQLDGERPSGVGRARYLRAWRRGRAAADPEVTADGRARLMTPAAWRSHGASAAHERRPPKVTPIRPADDAVLVELGLGTRRTA